MPFLQQNVIADMSLHEENVEQVIAKLFQAHSSKGVEAHKNKETLAKGVSI